MVDAIESWHVVGAASFGGDDGGTVYPNEDDGNGGEDGWQRRVDSMWWHGVNATLFRRWTDVDGCASNGRDYWSLASSLSCPDCHCCCDKI